jgi:thioredoxin reductase
MSLPTSSQSDTEYLIIGAGPAGLQLGYFLHKAGRSYRILEAGSNVGTFFRHYPRERNLISINKCYTGYDDPEINLRWDWNSLLSDDPSLTVPTNYSSKYFPKADVLVEYLEDFAAHYDLNIEFDARVRSIDKVDDTFIASTVDGRTFAAPRLISATGFTQPYLPDIPGIETVDVYNDVDLSLERFANDDVLILGKGNSAFEIADVLIPAAAVIHVLSPSPVTFAWKTHFVGDLRAVNNSFLDTYQLKSQNAVLDASVERIRKQDDGTYVVSVSYSHANGETEDLTYDHVIACTGFQFDPSIFDETCRPATAINGRYPDLTSAWESTTVDDLYFAGTLMHVRDYKQTTSSFIHGFRYNVRTMQKLFEVRYHDGEYPSRPVEPTVDGLTEAVLDRANRSSALWQQFGFLGDVIQIRDDRTARYVEELPVDYVHDTDWGRHPNYFIVTLEFGTVTGDPFAIERNPDPDFADDSTFLHPVVRHYSGDELLRSIHLIEDLYAEWDKPHMHVEPLRDFFTDALADTSPAGQETEAVDTMAGATA